MADAAVALTQGGVVSTTLQRLDALIEAFWEKLRAKQTLHETVITPMRPTCHTPSSPTALARGPLRLRRRRKRPRAAKQAAQRKAMSRQAVSRGAPQPYSPLKHMNDKQRAEEKGERHLHKRDQQLPPPAVGLQALALWDSKFPMMGIG
ncbi:Hypothetical predicted protein [Pelobates cultripes]|uniref:Uncharacterized protein n=1 Tax=Pelobates cultripes TaxID=61616 RepID=A0AAD1SV54_PELCU|nr:Hypothetical predicted protein [Pelobates cultripes]